MTVTVRIPTTLRPLTGGRAEVEADGSIVNDVLNSVDEAFSGFKASIIDDDGNLVRFVNIFVDDEDVRFVDGLNTEVPDGQTLSIVPAVAGG